MATAVDLRLGLNLTIGSLPVSLSATVDTTQGPGKTVYLFDGCVQDATISIGEFLGAVAEQFGVGTMLPPELNLDARIDYLAGQLIHATDRTEIGIAAQFTFTSGQDSLTLRFYADSATAPGTPGQYVIGAAIDTSLAFSSLPLVGDVPGFRDYAIENLGFSYTNADTTRGPVAFSIPQVAPAAPNPLYTRGDPTSPHAKVYAIDRSPNRPGLTLAETGFSFTASLTNNGVPVRNFALPLAAPAAPAPDPDFPAPTPFLDGTSTPASSPVHWLAIEKTFGPVHVEQVGLNYADGEATFGISAGFTVGGFTLDLEGLTITFPMPLPGQPAGHSVSFDLQGLAMSLQRGPVDIGGAFLKTATDQVTSYYGEFVVLVGAYGFRALGGYTPAHGGDPASFFLYANLSEPLGGPPSLFVTGLAAGFGINRSLVMPTLDEVPGYLLLPANAPPQGATPAGTIASVLPRLSGLCVDQPGAYWVAAGISFTSFEMIQAKALITVAFGVDLQVSLLGTCAMTFPKGAANPVAYVEIDLIASYDSAAGVLAVQGKLSPASYVYGGFCKLSGGFAFYTWFSGVHAGDFVVSLGGYHPAFVRPSHYPSVPRLGMAFGLGPFQVVGKAYFALTPAMMMAGGSLSATWSGGPASAWFDAGVDFLLAWSPFHYEGHAYVSVGCSVDLFLFTLHASVGADLTMWGPQFGGSADVDLDVVSFTISFGASPVPPPPMGWSSFRGAFLPPDTAPGTTVAGARASTCNIVKASVSAGLLKAGGGAVDWILDADHFVIVTNAVIPANAAEWTGAQGPVPISAAPADYGQPHAPFLVLPPDPFSAASVWNPALSVGPMKLTDVRSTHAVTLMKFDAKTRDFTAAITEVSVQPVLQSSNAALWAPDNPNRAPSDAALVPGTLAGFRITPMPRVPDSTSAVPLFDLLFAAGFHTAFTWGGPAVDGAHTVQWSVGAAPDDDLVIQIGGADTRTITNRDYLLGALMDPWVVPRRESILTELRTAGFDTSSALETDLTLLAGTTTMTDWPMVKLLGAS